MNDLSSNKDFEEAALLVYVKPVLTPQGKVDDAQDSTFFPDKEANPDSKGSSSLAIDNTVIAAGLYDHDGFS